MNAPLSRVRQRQHGLALIEFVLILPVLITLLTFPLFFSRYFMHYTVAQKSARDAAVFMARLPLKDMEDRNRRLAAIGVASDMVAAETRGLRPGRRAVADFSVQCDGGICGYSRPQTISVTVRMHMFDDFFPVFTTQAIGAQGVRISASASMNYIGQ